MSDKDLTVIRELFWVTAIKLASGSDAYNAQGELN